MIFTKVTQNIFMSSLCVPLVLLKHQPPPSPIRNAWETNRLMRKTTFPVNIPKQALGNRYEVSNSECRESV
jgi:hypothetical protein